MAAADGGAAGVVVGRDQGSHHQRSTMMLLDSTRNGCVGECTLSPLAHLQPKDAHTPGSPRSLRRNRNRWGRCLYLGGGGRYVS